MSLHVSYGSVNELIHMGQRCWGKYTKPFTFGIAVQTLEEIDNY